MRLLDNPLPLRIRFDGQTVLPDAPSEDSADTVAVCGLIGCDLHSFNPLIAALLHLRGTAADTWIAGFGQRAVAESHARRPCGEAMLARMSEMMFVDAVRRYADQLPAQSAGWLVGRRDRYIGRAPALMHVQPAQDWSIDELGRRVAPVTVGAA